MCDFKIVFCLPPMTSGQGILVWSRDEWVKQCIGLHKHVLGYINTNQLTLWGTHVWARHQLSGCMIWNQYGGTYRYTEDCFAQ